MTLVIPMSFNETDSSPGYSEDRRRKAVYDAGDDGDVLGLESFDALRMRSSVLAFSLPLRFLREAFSMPRKMETKPALSIFFATPGRLAKPIGLAWVWNTKFFSLRPINSSQRASKRSMSRVMLSSGAKNVGAPAMVKRLDVGQNAVDRDNRNEVPYISRMLQKLQRCRQPREVSITSAFPEIHVKPDASPFVAAGSRIFVRSAKGRPGVRKTIPISIGQAEYPVHVLAAVLDTIE